jgi:uncharacterized membrane protein (UPF0127 family)
MKIKLKNKVIEVGLADTFWKKLFGLSFHRNKNLLFTMDHEGRWSFWMFLVRYPIKMIFIDKNKVVIDKKEAEPLSLNPKSWKTYSSEKPCKYILETPFDLKIKIGDKLDFE